MGKFGIGARVKDGSGDLATIIDKRKGERFLHWDDQVRFTDCWWSKSELNLVDDDQVDPASSSSEKGELAYSAGDKLRWKGNWDSAFYTKGKVYEVLKVAGPGEWIQISDDNGESFHPLTGLDMDFDRVPALKLEAGKFYMTQLGRRVGPAIPITHPGVFAFAAREDQHGRVAAFWLAELGSYTINGEWLSGREDLNLVAEAPLKIEVGKFYRTRDGRKAGPVSVYVSDTFNAPINGDTNIVWGSGRGNSTPGHDFRTDLVAEWVEPTTKTTFPGWSHITLKPFPPDFSAPALTSPAVDLPIGTKVTVTGTVTGFNNDNRSVVFDIGGERKSFDFPTSILSAA